LKPFAPRPVVYRATDFKSNEYRHLKGGEKYEPVEENPMIGFRGASRYIKWQDVFNMELEAIKRVRAAGYKNIILMIPFVRTPIELMQIKSILAEQGLERSPTFKLWIMVEVPSAVILLEDMISLGIDGVSIGTNDLTMLLLGVDRDSHEVAHIYSEQNEAVMWALKKIVKTARKHDITVSVCGQAPSDYPDIAEALVRWGATSLSLNEDALDRTREMIGEVEGKLWHSLKR
jgi:pyruvate, water dikinase